MVSCVLKPFFIQLFDSLKPVVVAMYRRRRDKTGSVCSALKSMVLLRSLSRPAPQTPREKTSKELWEASQQDRFKTTATHFLGRSMQFGYMSMFAAVSPLAPFAAVVYSTIRLRLDAKRMLYYTQRPFASPCAGIGPWTSIFWIFTALSIITNAYLICVLGPAISALGFSPDAESRAVFFSVLQYILAALLTLAFLVVPSTPTKVEKQRVKQRLFADVAVRFRLTKLLSNKIALEKQSAASEASRSEAGDGASARADETPKFQPTPHSLNFDDTDDDDTPPLLPPAAANGSSRRGSLVRRSSQRRSNEIGVHLGDLEEDPESVRLFRLDRYRALNDAPSSNSPPLPLLHPEVL